MSTNLSNWEWLFLLIFLVTCSLNFFLTFTLKLRSVIAHDISVWIYRPGTRIWYLMISIKAGRKFKTVNHNSHRAWLISIMYRNRFDSRSHVANIAFNCVLICRMLAPLGYQSLLQWHLQYPRVYTENTTLCVCQRVVCLDLTDLWVSFAAAASLRDSTHLWHLLSLWIVFRIVSVNQTAWQFPAWVVASSINVLFINPFISPYV